MRIIVTGSRKLRNPWDLKAEILTTLQVALEHGGTGTTWREFLKTVTLVHGACRDGADRIAEELATEQKITVERYPADWSQGPSAGPIRNTVMVKSGADICIAAWNGSVKGSGTFDCMQKCVKAGIPVRVVPVGKEEE